MGVNSGKLLSRERRVLESPTKDVSGCVRKNHRGCHVPEYCKCSRDSKTLVLE